MNWGRYLLSTSVQQELVHEQPALLASCAFLPSVKPHLKTPVTDSSRSE